MRANELFRLSLWHITIQFFFYPSIEGALRMELNHVLFLIFLFSSWSSFNGSLTLVGWLLSKRQILISSSGLAGSGYRLGIYKWYVLNIAAWRHVKCTCISMEHFLMRSRNETKWQTFLGNICKWNCEMRKLIIALHRINCFAFLWFLVNKYSNCGCSASVNYHFFCFEIVLS